MFKQIEKGYTKKTLIESYNDILILMSPVIPHFTNECLEMLKNKNNNKWPEYNIKFIQEENIAIVIQINGKKRGIINLKKNTDEEELLNLIKKEETLNKYIADKKIKKQIYVKNKIINFII